MKDYKFKTLDEAREAIIDADLNLEINMAINKASINQLLRIIRTTFLWAAIFSSIFISLQNKINVFVVIVGYTALYIFFKFIVSWSWFNEDRYFRQIKLNTVNYILSNCKEWVEPERKPEEWEYKQIYNNMLRLVNLKVDDNKQ